jgi:hypothetical protein
MKELSIEQIEAISGQGLCYGGGIAFVAGVGLVGLAVATGGVGFLVAGGLGTYFGTTIGLICAMDPHRK